MAERMGISGRLAATFQANPLTPILAIAGLLLGLVAVMITPREEEPQIDVTMANVFIPFPGAAAKDVETLIAIPAEQVLSQIPGLEHVWSVSRPGQALITVQYEVGVPRTEAIVRLHDTILSHRDWLPPELNVGEPLIRPKGIDDVPIVALTLWTKDPGRGAYELQQVAHAVEVELKRGHHRRGRSPRPVARQGVHHASRRRRTGQGRGRALNHAAGFLRHALRERVILRHVPELRFVYDASVERGDTIERLLSKARAERDEK